MGIMYVYVFSRNENSWLGIFYEEKSEKRGTAEMAANLSAATSSSRA